MTSKSMNGRANHQHNEPRVSDLDLMMYLDGELDSDRHEQVREALAHDKVLQGKLAALDFSSSIVQEQAHEAAANIDVADSVMALIASSKDVVLDERDAAPGAKTLHIPVSEIAPVRLDKLGKKSGASNDNARGIFALAAFAVAAAAGLMIWGRVAPNSSTPASEPVAMMATTPETAAVVVAAPEPAAAPTGEAAVEAAEEQNDLGVEVAAVDFGSKVGAIFYVDADEATSKHTTTVVWLTDSDGEEQ